MLNKDESVRGLLGSGNKLQRSNPYSKIYIFLQNNAQTSKQVQ